MIDDLLCLFLSKDTFLEVTLEVNIKECRCTSEGHSSTVLVLNSTEVAEVQSLYSFLSCRSGLRNIAAVDSSHLLEVFKSTELICDLFSCTDLLISHRTGVELLLSLLVLDELIYTVKSNSSVVADDTASAVSIRKTCEDLVCSCESHLMSVNIEYTLIVSLAVFCEDVSDFGVDLVTIVRASLCSHVKTAVRHKSTLEGLICLETNDLFEILVNVACTVRNE